jgi:hypothetical protein
MSFTVLNRILAVLSFTLISCTALAKDIPPRVLQEPVLGLRYQASKVKFDPLPADVLAKCPTMADDENVQGRFWVYAFAQDAGRDFYVVGGYGVHRNPEPPGYPRYVRYDLGSIFFLEGNRCTVLGEAREVFDTGAFEETSVSALRRLAANLADRLTRAFGGQDRLRAELQNQHVDPDELSPELQEAFKAYFAPRK